MFSGRHFVRSVILPCVRWYMAYNPSLRNLEETMAVHGSHIDHFTVHRWVVHFPPLLLGRFNRRGRAVAGKWHVDETYVRVRGRWVHLYRVVDSVGDTVELFFSEKRDLIAIKYFIRKALKYHGRPDHTAIDGRQANLEAIVSCDATNRLQDTARRRLKPIETRKDKYLNNRIGQDHRRIKRRTRSILGFKSTTCAAAILCGIEMVHMMCKRQARYALIQNLHWSSSSRCWLPDNRTEVPPPLRPKFAMEPNKWPAFTPPEAGLSHLYRGRFLHRRSQVWPENGISTKLASISAASGCAFTAPSIAKDQGFSLLSKIIVK